MLKDASYLESVSAFFLSGGYVVYFPDSTKAINEFNLDTGGQPGMTVIDTDPYRS